MNANDGLKYVVEYIIGMMQRFKFNTVSYEYDAKSPENSFLSCLETCFIFSDKSGYPIVIGNDGMEYASGNNPFTAIQWDGSRPNVSYIKIGNIKETLILHMNMIEAAIDGGFVPYQWIDPHKLISQKENRIAYIKQFDNYLLVLMSYDPDKNVGSISIVTLMVDFIQQFVSNFMLTNNSYRARNYRFLSAIDDGNVTLIDDTTVVIGTATMKQIQKAIHLTTTYGGGYIDDHTFCTKIAFTNLIIWYSIRP